MAAEQRGLRKPRASRLRWRPFERESMEAFAEYLSAADSRRRLRFMPCVPLHQSRVFAAGFVCWLLFIASDGFSAERDYVELGKSKAHSTRLLARFSDRTIPASDRAILNPLGFQVSHEFKLVPGLVVLDLESSQLKYPQRSPGLESARTRLFERIRQLRASGLFDYVEPDFVQRASAEPSDARFADDTLWGLRNRGSDGGVSGADIDAVRAWEITTGATNVIVAVIDSGIRYTHRELAAQMWRNPGEIPANGLDDDGDGYADNVFGINALNNSGDPFDDTGHGTHVAGTIGAAANDGNPHVGVAWQVRLMACKFMAADGFGLTSDAIRCIDFAAAKGARIINASWESGAFSRGLFEVIAQARDKGVLFVTAAGNDLGDLDSSPSYPTSYELDNVISVAALDRRDQLASFSNFGQHSVHLGAPGAEVFSTYASSDSAYWTLSGSSMAAPYVSGVAALILAKFSAALLPEIRNRILTTVVPVESLRKTTRTGGRLNAYRALTAMPDGNLELTVTPQNGADVRAGSTVPIQVTVTDLAGITNAIVSARMDGSSEALILRHESAESSTTLPEATYGSRLVVPDRVGLLTLRLRVVAPDKNSAEETLVYSVIAPPENDDFSNATRVPAAGGVFSVANKLATLEAAEPMHGRAPAPAASVWWQWSPANRTRAIVDSAGSSFDTVLAVYTNATLQTLREVASVDDSDQKKQGYVIFDAVPGVDYFIAVAGYSARDLGTVHLRVQPFGAPDERPPEVAIVSPLSGFTLIDPASSRVVIAGTAFDPEPDASGVEEVLVRVNSNLASRAFGTTKWASTNLLEVGENSIQVVAVDFSRNISPAHALTLYYRPLLTPNDLFADSIELVGRQGNAKADNSGATVEFGEPLSTRGTEGKSVWWHYRPTSDGLLTLSTEGSSFDTFMALYTGNRVTNLNWIAENDDAHLGVSFSAIHQAVKAFETYRIVVDGRGAASGTVNLAYAFTPTPVYRLNVTATSGGTVTPSSGWFANHERVVLNAISAPNFQFDRWEGSVSSVEETLFIVMTNHLELTARFRPYEFTDGFESGDLGKLNWKTSGDAAWTVQSQTAANGRFAARSGLIEHGQTSTLTLAEACRAGTGSFNVRISSEEGWDFLEFILNGRRIQRWSGEVAWTACEFPVSEGVNTFEWRYSKDPGGTSAGLDAGFLDNLELPLFVPFDSTTPARLKIESLAADRLQLHALGQIKQRYRIQESGDLKTWTTLSTNVATNGVFRYEISVRSNAPVRFFRDMAF